MTTKREVAILSLESAILFPNMVIPMHIFDKNYIELIDFATKSGKQVAITLKDPNDGPMTEGTMSCLGDITFSNEELIEDTEGIAVVVSGISRAVIKKIKKTEPFYTASLELIPDECSSQTEFNHCKETLQKKLVQYLFLNNLPEKDIHLANLLVDPGHVADFVAFYFIDDMYTKMDILETPDVCARCLKVEQILDILIANSR